MSNSIFIDYFRYINGRCLSPVQETNPFTYVEINGLKVPEPSAAYPLLWEAISGHDTSRDGMQSFTRLDAQLTIQCRSAEDQ
jgi:Cdc6-like AAA superfamily ATPase